MYLMLFLYQPVHIARELEPLKRTNGQSFLVAFAFVDDVLAFWLVLLGVLCR